MIQYLMAVATETRAKYVQVCTQYRICCNTQVCAQTQVQSVSSRLQQIKHSKEIIKLNPRPVDPLCYCLTIAKTLLVAILIKASLKTNRLPKYYLFI